MSESPNIYKQFSHYGVANIIVMCAGFITFPILTRIFSVNDYGMLGLINTTLFVAVAFAKFGFPNSVVRFYAEANESNSLSTFYSTIFLSSTVLFIFIALIFFIIVKSTSCNFFDANIKILPIISFLILFGCINDVLTSFLRAEQKTKLYNYILVFRRYGSVFLSVFFVLFFIQGLNGFYLGQILAATLTLATLLFVSLGKQKIRIKLISPILLKDSIKYGFPTIWNEIGHLVLNYADRYLIQIFLGSASLGLYSAGYNLTWYVTQLILHPVSYAITPIYMNILVNKGVKETKAFFTMIIKYFFLIVIPLTFGFIAVGENLINFLASSKYTEAYTIIPYIIIGHSIYSSTIILNSGLYINKKTYIVTTIMFITCVLNVALNTILIPKTGIIGAALATLISYIFYTFVIIYYSFKEFKFPIEYMSIFYYLIAGLIMFFSVRHINIGSTLLNLISQTISGMFIYILCVLVLDSQIRQKSLIIIRSLKERALNNT